MLTISVVQLCCAGITEYGIPSDFVRKSTTVRQIKVSAAPPNLVNSLRNVIIYSENRIINKDNEAHQIITCNGVYPLFISQFVFHHQRIL